MDMLHVQNGRIPNLLLLTGFGGSLKPRYWVRKTDPALQVGMSIKEFLVRAPT
jgi:hypothetical protein